MSRGDEAVSTTASFILTKKKGGNMVKKVKRVVGKMLIWLLGWDIVDDCLRREIVDAIYDQDLMGLISDAVCDRISSISDEEVKQMIRDVIEEAI